jgi:PIN domain nuclease of toxin-antitoxin system
MNILLDTHVLIWLAISPQNLSQQATNIITDPTHTLLLMLYSTATQYKDCGKAIGLIGFNL